TSSGTYRWTGTATGQWHPVGTVAAGYGFHAGAAPGFRAPIGQVNRSYGWRATDLGAHPVFGQVASLYTFAGAAAGAPTFLPDYAGQAAGVYTWIGSRADGKSTPQGHAAGGFRLVMHFPIGGPLHTPPERTARVLGRTRSAWVAADDREATVLGRTRSARISPDERDTRV